LTPRLLEWVIHSDSDGDSLDSDEKAEREEEKAWVTECFTKLNLSTNANQSAVNIWRCPATRRICANKEVWPLVKVEAVR